jgi:putative SbcD/Mre11-related phosphoesterase
MMPRVYFKEFLKKLSKLLDGVEVVVINGDLKHEFGKVSVTEYRGGKEMFDLLQGKKIIVIQGNHDPLLKAIVKNLEIKMFYKIGEVLICHGDEILKEECKVIVIGHEHAAIGLKEGERFEKYKCFLKGSYKGKVLIAMPSANQIVEGADILREERLSPYLRQDLKNFEVYIISDKVYNFGKVKDLN